MDDSALLRDSIEVTLGGRIYEFKEFSRRQSRTLRAKLIKPFSKLELNDEKTIDEDLLLLISSDMLDSLNVILDIFIEEIEVLKEDAEHIEKYSTDKEIIDSFVALTVFLNRSIGSPHNKKKEGKKKTR